MKGASRQTKTKSSTSRVTRSHSKSAPVVATSTLSLARISGASNSQRFANSSPVATSHQISRQMTTGSSSYGRQKSFSTQSRRALTTSSAVAPQLSFSNPQPTQRLSAIRSTSSPVGGPVDAPIAVAPSRGFFQPASVAARDEEGRLPIAMNKAPVPMPSSLMQDHSLMTNVAFQSANNTKTMKSSAAFTPAVASVAASQSTRLQSPFRAQPLQTYIQVPLTAEITPAVKLALQRNRLRDFGPNMAHEIAAYNLDSAIDTDTAKETPALELMNRNKRRPKKANHGARPCSSFMRAKRRLRRHNSTKK